MNVVLNIKESQLRGVLDTLRIMGDELGIVVNIEEEEGKEKISRLTTDTLEQIQEGIQKEEEKEAKQEEEAKEEKEEGEPTERTW